MTRGIEQLSLDGHWEARVDPDDVGLHEGWYLADVPFDRRLVVPGAWQTADTDLARYAGVVWYRTTFRLPAYWPSDCRVAATFGAVDYRANIFLNGSHLGDHEGGYIPFDVDVSPALDHSRCNVLVVRVEDRAGVGDRPHGKQGGVWYTPTSGLWQPVVLSCRPREHIAGLTIMPDLRRMNTRITGRAILDDRRGITLRIADAAGRLAIRADVDVDPDQPWFDVEVRVASPRPWELDDPHLYTLRARFTGDSNEREEVARFGMRSIEAHDGRIWLNGHRQEIRGALDQAFWPDRAYVLPNIEAARHELERAKALGFNLLRKHIKPEDPRYLDLADELGMLVWAEPANPDRFTPASFAALRRDLLEMIERDANHPSIVVWGIYNEDWGIEDLWSEPDRQAALERLVADVRALDPTRLVVDNSGWAHVATDINDSHEYVSLPEQAGVLDRRLAELVGSPDDNFAAGHRADDEPILISEFGAWMLADPASIRDRYNGAEPGWFDHAGGYQRAPGDTLHPAEGDPLSAIATVTGFEGRLAAAGLQRGIASPSDVVRHAQRRGARSIAGQIDAFRRHPEIAGFVATELTDTEWEANGWLDAWREPKAGHELLAEANAPLGLIVRPDRRTILGGDSVELEISLVNDTPRTASGTLVVGEASRRDDAADVLSVEPFSRRDGIRRTFAMPDGPSAPVDISVSWQSTDGRLAARVVELARIAPADLVRQARRATGPALPRLLRQRLERHGYRMPRGWDRQAEVAIVDRLDDDAIAYVHEGGRLLHLGEEFAPEPSPLGIRYRQLPGGESWEMHTGVAWARADLLAPAPMRPDLGWESADVFPRLVIDTASVEPGDLLLAGWFEGWGAFAGAFAVGREVGRGRIMTTTFRLADRFGLDPFATILLDRLVDLLADPFPAYHAGPGWAATGDRR